jgi:hypothetical protein
MKAELWKVVIVSAWATPGAITFRPPDKPAIAIALSEARKKGKKVPRRRRRGRK